MNGHLFNEWPNGHFSSKKGFKINFWGLFSKRRHFTKSKVDTVAEWSWIRSASYDAVSILLIVEGRSHTHDAQVLCQWAPSRQHAVSYWDAAASLRTRVHTDAGQGWALPFRHSGDKEMFSLQVACILVTVSVGLRRAVRGFMNHDGVIMMQGDALRSSGGTKGLKQRGMFSIYLNEYVWLSRNLESCKALPKRCLSHFKPVFPFTPNSSLR